MKKYFIRAIAIIFVALIATYSYLWTERTLADVARRVALTEEKENLRWELNLIANSAHIITTPAYGEFHLQENNNYIFIPYRIPIRTNSQSEKWILEFVNGAHDTTCATFLDVAFFRDPHLKLGTHRPIILPFQRYSPLGGMPIPIKYESSVRVDTAYG